MVEIESVSIRLGEKDYTVAEASFLRAKPWKEKLINEVQPIFGEVAEAQNITFESAVDLVQLMPLAQRLFVDAMDLIFELLVSYSSVLEDERDYIANYATDKQIMAAFQEVVRLADPFGMINQLTRQLGRRAAGTLSNLPSANGVSASESVQS